MPIAKSAWIKRLDVFVTNWPKLKTIFPVNVPDPIYAKVDLEEGLDFHVQLRKCWATPTDSATDETNYTFIDNFAAVDTDNMEVTQNCAVQESD